MMLGTMDLELEIDEDDDEYKKRLSYVRKHGTESSQD